MSSRNSILRALDSILTKRILSLLAHKFYASKGSRMVRGDTNHGEGGYHFPLHSSCAVVAPTANHISLSLHQSIYPPNQSSYY
ncbi:MAG: hypothetical protein ACFCUU_15160 [Cyclobacteriaceae bacterium]